MHGYRVSLIWCHYNINYYHHNRCLRSCYNRGYRHTGLLEVQVYPFLVLPLMGLGGQDHKPSPVLPKKNVCVLNKKLAKPTTLLYRYGKEKNFFPLTVFILQTVPPADPIGKIKGFRNCGWKQTPCIRALRQHQRAKHA